MRCFRLALFLSVALPGVILAQSGIGVPPGNIVPNYDRVPVGQREGIEGGAYVARTGLDPRPHLPTYLAYNFFRIAAILQGIVGRVRDGTATSDFAPAKADMIRPLADTAWQFAREAGAR